MPISARPQVARGALRRLRTYVALAVVLAVTVLVVPDAGVAEPDAALVKVDVARGIEHPDHVLWVLALGSDARPGEQVTRSRADAIQLVGINLRSGDGVIFGVPRDSWVPIDGHGSNRVNSAMHYGGPELMGRTVGRLFGIDVDYVFVAGFGEFDRLVRAIGGVTVHSRLAFSDDNLKGSYRAGKNRVNGGLAVNFGRMRHFLPRGDFDRSANQSELIKAIAREVHKHEDTPGFIERGTYAAVRNLHTDLSPAELYRLAQAATDVRPGRLRSCVLRGSIGNIGGASVVIPDLGHAQRLGADALKDARLDRGC
jgi:LCP family protein required for cell wall assembly